MLYSLGQAVVPFLLVIQVKAPLPAAEHGGLKSFILHTDCYAHVSFLSRPPICELLNAKASWKVGGAFGFKHAQRTAQWLHSHSESKVQAQGLRKNWQQPRDFSPRRQFLIKRLDYGSCTDLCISKLQWQMVPPKVLEGYAARNTTASKVSQKPDCKWHCAGKKPKVPVFIPPYDTQAERKINASKVRKHQERKEAGIAPVSTSKAYCHRTWKQPQTFHNSQKS